MEKGKKVLGLPVFTVIEGEKVGKVKDVVVDPQGKKVKVLLIETPTWYESYKVLPFKVLQSLGEDVLMVKSKAEIISLPEVKEVSSLKKGLKIGDKKVVTTSGRLKGQVSDFLIEPKTGKITLLEVELAKDSHRREWVSMDNFVSLGKEALIVTEEQEDRSRVKGQGLRVESEKTGEKAEDVVAEKVADVAAPPKAGPKEEKVDPPTDVGAGVSARPERGSVRPEAKPTEVGTEPRVGPEEPKKGGLRKFLEGRQDKYLIGKKVGKNLVAQDGNLIAKAGEEITEETIKKAKETQRYLSLSFFAKEK